MQPLDQVSNQKVMVTGASGFIGSHLLQALVEGGAEVHAVSRQERTGSDERGRWWIGDLAEMASVQQLVSTIRPDVIFHLAGYVSGDRSVEAVLPAFRGNLASAVNLLSAATAVGCRRIILAGSLEEPRSGAGAEVPASPYAAAKGAASAYARMYHALYDTPAVIARLFMVYGPAQQDLRKLIPYSVLSLLGRRPLLLSSGRRPVDWIYVKDAVAGLLATAVAPGVEGMTVDLGSGELVPVRDVVETVAKLIDPDGKLLFGAHPERRMEQVRAADALETEKQIGWRSSTGLEEGLNQTVSWYRQRFLKGEIDLSSMA
jgi:UDP-glucose 4-epimerase